jgi:hypothetical protein
MVQGLGGCYQHLPGPLHFWTDLLSRGLNIFCSFAIPPHYFRIVATSEKANPPTFQLTGSFFVLRFNSSAFRPPILSEFWTIWVDVL